MEHIRKCADCGKLHWDKQPCSKVPEGNYFDPPSLAFDFTDADLWTCPCGGSLALGREWLGGPPRCTCGAGDPSDSTLLHAVDCDTIPCPFCPLEREQAKR